MVLVFLFWGLIPATTPHPHEEYEPTTVKKEERPVKPIEVIKKAEQVLAQATVVVEKLEKEKAAQSSDKPTARKPGTRQSEGRSPTPPTANAKTVAQPASAALSSQKTQEPPQSDHQP